MQKLRRCLFMVFIASLTFNSPRSAQAYGLATHLLLVDLLWDESILPLLQKSFPNTNPRDYEQARRYAYSGAVIQDAGYYYYKGDKQTRAEIQHFSDMTHYARSGDFITNLFRSVTNVNELAFALGALTHYVGDIEGHSLATNPSVALAFPNHFPDYTLVTYEQEPDDHLQTEFGFDVNAIKLMRLRPPSQMKYQRANLSLQQLTYAYYRTYGMRKDLTWTGDGFSARAFYASANLILPTGTYLRARAETTKPIREADSVGLEAMIDKVATTEHWKRQNHYTWIPRPVARIILRATSKSAMVMPNSTTQLNYARSVASSVETLKTVISSIKPDATIFIPLWISNNASASSTSLPNKNLDTGELEVPGKYGLSDRIHQVWLAEVAATPGEYPKWPLPPSAHASLLSFFSNPLPSWNADAIHNALESIKILPPWPDNEPCPNADPQYKQYFGWHMRDPQNYNQPDPRHPGLCPYPGPPNAD